MTYNSSSTSVTYDKVYFDKATYVSKGCICTVYIRIYGTRDAYKGPPVSAMPSMPAAFMLYTPETYYTSGKCRSSSWVQKRMNINEQQNNLLVCNAAHSLYVQLDK